MYLIGISRDWHFILSSFILFCFIVQRFLCKGNELAGIKEYQFTYINKCNKIPPKDILSVFLLL